MAEKGRTTNYPYGVTNRFESDALGNLIIMDPSKSLVFWDDFLKWNAVATTGAADWVMNNTGAGTAALIADASGGILQATTDAGGSDAFWAQWKGQNASTDVAEIIAWEATKRFWMKTRFKLGDASEGQLRIGAWTTDTAPASIADGIYFAKADNVATLTMGMIKTGASSSSVNIGTLVDDTYIELALDYNPDNGVFTAWVDNQRAGQITTTANAPTTELSPSFGVINGTTAASVLSMDYLLLVKER